MTIVLKYSIICLILSGVCVVLNRIKELREKANLRQIDVAQKTGIDQKTLSNYETEKTNPDCYALIKLADFFGVSIDYLVGRSNVDENVKTLLSQKIELIEKQLEEIKKYL